jgi:UDP:flavonoid glycosyltransferase YjiC (YdhE family)
MRPRAMKYLFVTWDGGGNLPPELAVASRLVGRGHEVRFLGHRSQGAAVKEAGCGFTAFEQAPDADLTHPDATVNRGPKLLAQLRERLFFGPAAAFAADVLAELDRHRADAVAVDCMLFGALAAAERSGLPSAALYHTIYSPPTLDVPPFGRGFGLPKNWRDRLWQSAFRGVAARLWKKGLPAFNAARAGIGLPPLSRVFEQFDRLDRVLLMSSPAFDFAALGGTRLPANVRYVGAQVDVEREDRVPADPADRRARVLVSFSTGYQAQKPVVRRAVAALGTLPVQALVTTGPALELNGPAPANVEVRSFVPHAEVLPHTDLVVTHAGMGTVMVSLAHGVPLVCLPMGRDQLDVAARLVHAGAGRRLPPGADEAKIAAVVRDALADHTLTVNAGRLGQAIRDEVAADRAVAELEALPGDLIYQRAGKTRASLGTRETDDIEGLADELSASRVSFERYDTERSKTDEKGIAIFGVRESGYVKHASFKDPYGNSLGAQGGGCRPRTDDALGRPPT